MTFLKKKDDIMFFFFFFFFIAYESLCVELQYFVKYLDSFKYFFSFK